MNALWNPLIILTLVATSTYGQAINAFAKELPVPKYVEYARELVATVKPESNKYVDNGPDGVRWKGEFFASENSVHTACGPFVHAVFDKAKDKTVDAIMLHVRASRDRRHSYIHFLDWWAALENGWGLKKIENVKEVQVGDLFMFYCHDSCKNSQADAAGHIVIVDEKPNIHNPTQPIIPNTLQWSFVVIDSADNPHDMHDTRYINKTEKVTGVGRGTYRVYTDLNGVPIGYTNGYSAKFHGIDVRTIAIGRPSY